MTRAVPLPPQFATLTVQYVQRVSDTEYCSECPECGGEVHRNGEWPDRLRIFTGGNPRIWCRRCNLFKWADQLDDSQAPSRQDLEAWRKEQVQREEARKRSAELALANLRDSQRWARYYAQLEGTGREYWRGRGIPNAWQDYLQLGWQEQSRWGMPTATIPLFNQEWDVLNIKHRLINAEGSGKYRYELHGLSPPLFRTEPDAMLDGHVVAVEGEIKAAVVKVTLDDNTCVVGLPGSTPPQSIAEQLGQAERVTLVMDPGEDEHAAKLAWQIGRGKCRLLIPPVKIDDGILAAKMDGKQVKRLLGQATPI